MRSLRITITKANRSWQLEWNRLEMQRLYLRLGTAQVFLKAVHVERAGLIDDHVTGRCHDLIVSTLCRTHRLQFALYI